MVDAVHSIVAGTAARYKRMCWWVDVDDLKQVGYVAAITAEPLWSPRVGVPIEAYLCRAIALAMHREVWSASSPVSGGKHDPKRNLAGLTRAQFNDNITTSSDAEHLLENAEWEQAVNVQLANAGIPPLVVDVLLDRVSEKDAARKAGTTPHTIRRHARMARESLAGNLELWHLHKERKAW